MFDYGNRWERETIVQPIQNLIKSSLPRVLNENTTLQTAGKLFDLLGGNVD